MPEASRLGGIRSERETTAASRTVYISRLISTYRRPPASGDDNTSAHEVGSMRKALMIGAAAAIVAATPVSSVQAEPIADFYRGKTLRMLIGYGPGGGYGIY